MGEDRHKEEIARLQDSHKEETASLDEKQKSEMDKLKEKQKDEKDEHDNIRSNNQKEKTVLEKKLQSRLNPPAPSPSVPECPVCLDEMLPPLQIHNCRNGHLICGLCRVKVKNCTICREEYTGRATA